MFDYITLFLIFVTLLTACILFLRINNCGLPPGPSSLPIFGYYPFLDSRPYITLMNLSKCYNSDIISFRTLGGNLMVILHSLPLVKEALISRSDEFIGRPLHANIIQWPDNGYGIEQSEGSTWKEQKRFFLQTMRDFGVGKAELEDRIGDEIKTALNEIQELQGKSFNPRSYINIAVGNVIYYLLCNKHFKKDDPHFKDITDGFHYVTNFFIGRQFFITGYIFKLVLMLSSAGRMASKAKQGLNEAVAKLVDQEIDSFDSQHIRHFIDAYWCHALQLKEKMNQQSSFLRARLYGIVLNSLVDGMESVGTTIECLLLLLGTKLEEQKKAQEEIDNVIGTENMPSWKDKSKLPYTDALILELYRHAQPFFVSSLYSNFRETTLGGYRIPKRSVIVANLWSIHNNPDFFPEPEKFDPQRFLDSDGKRVKREGPYPFGIGKRSCAGEPLAQVEVFLFVVSLLQNFTIETVSEDTIRALPRRTMK